jgi:hypothetical protein
MAYAFLSWEFTADICLLKFIYLENKVPTPYAIWKMYKGRDMHIAFKTLHIYDLTIKVWK